MEMAASCKTYAEAARISIRERARDGNKLADTEQKAGADRDEALRQEIR